MKKPYAFLLVTSFVMVFPGPIHEGPQFKRNEVGEMSAPIATTLRVDANYGKMPLYFIPNQGQMDKQVVYYVQGKDRTLYFTDEGITLALTKPTDKCINSSRLDPKGLFRDIQEDDLRSQKSGVERSEKSSGERWVVKLDFVGANKYVTPIGEQETGGIVSYFKGKPEEWHAGLPTYSKILYPNLWPGIDLVYYGTVNRLKYEFIVHPGADPSKIRLAYRGVESVSVDGDGRLQVNTPVGSFSDDVPVAYQEIGGTQHGVSLFYKLDASVEMKRTEGSRAFPGENLEWRDLSRFQSAHRREESKIHGCAYGFEVGRYDHSRTLVLDPALLVYCGYIGGSSSETGYGIAVDGAGNAYITGRTLSAGATFPVTVGPDLTFNGEDDAFVAKVNSAGTALVYCGYIGGSSYDNGNAIAVDGAGNAYVTGSTSSSGATFPVTVGPDLTFNGTTDSDAFVAKVNSAGTALVYCGYIGGRNSEAGSGIAVDGAGNAYVTGDTFSTQSTFPAFPVKVGPDLTHNGAMRCLRRQGQCRGHGPCLLRVHRRLFI